MTGYARAEGRDGRMSWVWEVKSVNGRGLETRLRLPSGCDALDPEARAAVARRFRRGNLQLGLSVSVAGEAAAVRLDTARLERILAVCIEWRDRFPGVAMPSWDGLLALKGVLEPPETEAEEDTMGRAARLSAMSATLETALEGLETMRRAEGARLTVVLTGHLDEIAALSVRAAATATLRPEQVRDRLRAQLAAVLEAIPALSEDRLAQELALIAVKGDVREELDRLSAHVAAARDLLAEGGAVGRKLDFLAQEFNREANTLCSKSADVELTRIGLDLKGVIDQFREQVQNIE